MVIYLFFVVKAVYVLKFRCLSVKFGCFIILCIAAVFVDCFFLFVSAEDIKLHLVSKESKVQIGKSAYFELTIRCSIFTVNNNNNNFEFVQCKFHRMFKCASQ